MHVPCNKYQLFFCCQKIALQYTPDDLFATVIVMHVIAVEIVMRLAGLRKIIRCRRSDIPERNPLFRGEIAVGRPQQALRAFGIGRIFRYVFTGSAAS